MQHNEIGTQKDLVLYRINAAKEDLQSAKILWDASDYDDFYIATKEEADEQIVIAEEFIQMVEAYCKKQDNK